MIRTLWLFVWHYKSSLDCAETITKKVRQAVTMWVKQFWWAAFSASRVFPERIKLGRLLIALALSTFSVSFANAQTSQNSARCVPAWGQFAGSADLPSTILSGARGPDGFIYLGGRDGLYRLEGRAVEYWRPDFSDPGALPAGRITSLVTDGELIWVATAAGLARFNPGTNRIDRVTLTGENERQPAITALARLGAFLYVAYNGTLMRLNVDQDTKAPETLSLDQATSLTIRNLLATPTGVFVATSKGLYLIDERGQSTAISMDGETPDITAMIMGPDGRLWALSNDAVWIASDPLSEDWERHHQSNTPGLASGTLIAMTMDQNNRVWIGSDEGLTRWDNGAQFPAECRRALLGSDRDQDVSVAFLTAEFGPYIFLGSNGRGTAYAPLSENISLIIPGERFSPGLPENPIWSSEITSEGRLVVGTSRGLFQETFPGARQFEEIGAHKLGNARIYKVKDLGPKGIWIGTNKGLFRVNGQDVETLTYVYNGDDLPALPAVFDIEHYENRIYLATARGLLAIDDSDLSPHAFLRTSDIYYVPEVNVQNDLATSRVWSLDWHQDDLLFAGSDGAFRLDPQTYEIKASTLPASDNGSFVVGRIYSIVGSQGDEVFLGTEAGLVVTSRNFDVFKPTSQINGLSIESVMAAGRARDGAIWIGAAGHGLFRLDPITEAWQHITTADGLITNGVSQLGLTIASDGRVVVSNATGASIINQIPDGYSSKQGMVFSVSDQYSQSKLNDVERFVIGPDRRDLRLHFAVAELVEPDRLRVDYSFAKAGSTNTRLSVPLGEDLTFLNLAPGRYDFDASLASSSGKELAARRFMIEVKPFWWERQETYVLLIALIIACAFALLLYRARAIERRYELVANERKRVAQDLHDTFLQDVFGARMLGRSLSSTQPNEESRNKVEQIMTLLESATSSVRKSVSELSTLTDVPELSEAVRMIEPSTMLLKDLKVTIDEHGNPWPMGAQRRFFVARIVQEAINNACKHSSGTKIHVKLNWSWWALRIKVTDDGKGFDRNSSDFKAGFGLESMDCMAEAARAKLNVHSQKQNGTLVSLKVPRFFDLSLD